MGGTSATSGPTQLLDKVGPVWVAACLAAVVHAQAVNGGFVWLDHAHLGAGAAVAEPGSWLTVFTRGFADTGYYRPLMALVLSLDAMVDSARWYHLHSLVWHAAAAALLAKLALELRLSRLGALLCGGVAAVHRSAHWSPAQSLFDPSPCSRFSVWADHLPPQKTPPRRGLLHLSRLPEQRDHVCLCPIGAACLEPPRGVEV